MENQDNAIQPAITWLNMSGDVTITWTPENKAHILNLVRQKMAEGYSFFVLTPRVIPFLGNKKEKLTRPQQLQKAVGVVVSTAQANAIVQGLGDSDVEAAVNSGHAQMAAPSDKKNRDTTHRATTAEEVIRSQSVAIRPIVGG